jgi:hypothetical protein
MLVGDDTSQLATLVASWHIRKASWPVYSNHIVLHHGVTANYVTESVHAIRQWSRY